MYYMSLEDEEKKPKFTADAALDGYSISVSNPEKIHSWDFLKSGFSN